MGLREPCPLVQIWIGKLSQSAMLDSDAQISCLLHSIFRKSGLSEQFELQKSYLDYVVGASGTAVKVMATHNL